MNFSAKLGSKAMGLFADRGSDVLEEIHADPRRVSLTDVHDLDAEQTDRLAARKEQIKDSYQSRNQPGRRPTKQTGRAPKHKSLHR